jgi:hypothetical protein
MKTPKEYYYTYYSYEEWGKGYFGSRGCKCLPEKDIKYFGTFRDKTFRPTQKIILKDDYATREEAYADEIILHDYYDVANNSHFANKAKATSTKFCLSKEQQKQVNDKQLKEKIGIHAIPKEIKKELGRNLGKKSKREKKGIFSLSPEERSENAKKFYKQKKGIAGLTKEQRVKNAKKGGSKSKELGVGIFALSKEERSKNAKQLYESGSGFGSMTYEQRMENGRKTSSQKWKCLETDYVSTPAGLSHYQKKRGIDTSKRIRIE